MSDEATTPVQQGNPPVQQVETPPAGSTQAGPPEGYIEKARYTGLVKKVDELTQTIQKKDADIAAMASKVEQLQQQLGAKDAEGNAAVEELKRQLQSNTEANTTITSELQQLRDFKAKVDAAMSMNRPDLIRIATQIPSASDPEQLKVLLEDIAGFTQTQVQAREQQIFSGVVQAGGGPTNAPAAPTSPEGWSQYIEKFPLGSPERNKALNDYGNWVEAQHRG